MRITLLSLALLISTNVWAAISITGASGVSSYSGVGTPTIFGALGGNDCGGDAGVTATTTCNSCTSLGLEAAPVNTCTTAPLCVCSTVRIHSTLQVQIALTKEAADTGDARATITNTTTPGNTAQTITLSSNSNGGTSVAFPWSELCRAMLGDSSCGPTVASTNFTGTLTIWLDKNSNGVVDTDEPQTTANIRVLNPPAAEAVFGNTLSEGIGSFSPYPGDEKIKIEQTNAASSFPNLTYNGIATTVRVFIAEATMNDAYPKGTASNQLAHVDLPIDTGTNELIENKVDGLTNDTRYYFRIAIVDNAGNVVQYFPAYTGLNADCTAGGFIPNACPYSAVPSEVLGMLSKDLNCFIATAAYGSGLEPKLKIFRDFRYHVLLRHDWGVWFVKKYYSFGPKAALFIYDKPVLRAITRVLLWPLLGFSWLAVHLGLVPSLLILLGLVSAMAFASRSAFRRSTARA